MTEKIQRKYNADKNEVKALTGVAQLGEMSLVEFPVRIHIWVSSLVPNLGLGERQLMDVSFLLFFPPFLPL